MAVTNLRERKFPGKVIQTRSMLGNGSPVGNATLAVDKYYPIGSDYLDLDDNTVYNKVAAETWEKEANTSVIKGATADATTDFGTLAVGDTVVHILVADGTSVALATVTAGTNPHGVGVVNDFYLIFKV